MKFVAITRRLAFAAFAGALAATPAMAQTYDGDWEGVLEAPNGAKLRLALQVKTEGGETKAVLNSLDQGAVIPSTAVKTDGGELQILFMPIMGELKGKLTADGKAIDGSWTQGGSIPLKLTKAATSAK
jgi:serine-type D-Ala-D-Ala carboxypeptidase/endopeptidase